MLLIVKPELFTYYSTAEYCRAAPWYRIIKQPNYKIALMSGDRPCKVTMDGFLKQLHLCHTWPDHFFMNKSVHLRKEHLPLVVEPVCYSDIVCQIWRLFPAYFVCVLRVECEQWSITGYQIGVRAIFSLALSLWCWRCSCVQVSATLFTCRQTVSSAIKISQCNCFALSLWEETGSWDSRGCFCREILAYW